MSEKRQAKAQSVVDTRTPEEIAEERIAEWKRNPNKPKTVLSFGPSLSSLDLARLGLKKVPETLREVRDCEFLTLNDNEIQEFPRWIGELSALLRYRS